MYISGFNQKKHTHSHVNEKNTGTSFGLGPRPRDGRTGYIRFIQSLSNLFSCQFVLVFVPLITRSF